MILKLVMNNKVRSIPDKEMDSLYSLVDYQLEVKLTEKGEEVLPVGTNPVFGIVPGTKCAMVEIKSMSTKGYFPLTVEVPVGLAEDLVEITIFVEDDDTELLEKVDKFFSKFNVGVVGR